MVTANPTPSIVPNPVNPCFTLNMLVLTHTAAIRSGTLSTMRPTPYPPPTRQRQQCHRAQQPSQADERR